MDNLKSAISSWERRWLDPDNDRDFYHSYGSSKDIGDDEEDEPEEEEED